MAKLGVPFEQVVADVLREMDPNAVVEQGKWEIGPDGRRELDVQVTAIVDGVRRRALIECKDFNPRTTGPVGITLIDALESKRRDLKLDVAFICSNAGFTADAIRKARRVGIGLFAILREKDERIRFQVSEEIYFRKVKVERLTFTCTPLTTQNPDVRPINCSSLSWAGVPVENWLISRAVLLLGANPIVNGNYTATYALCKPLPFEHSAGLIALTTLALKMKLSGGWFAQQVTLDATSGIYDWLGKCFRLTPGPGRFLLHNVDLTSGEPIVRPPDSEIHFLKNVPPGAFKMRMLLYEGIEIRKPVPPLDDLIVKDDLTLIIPNLPPEAYVSTGSQSG